MAVRESRGTPVSAVCVRTELTVSEEAEGGATQRHGRTWPVVVYNGANSDSQNGSRITANVLHHAEVPPDLRRP